MHNHHTFAPVFSRVLIIITALIVLIYTASTAHAETLISGTLVGNTTWTPTASPYIITANTTIPAGATLTIEPGTIVKMSGNFFLYIFGTLTAEGTALDPIIITSLRDDTVSGDTNGDGDSSAPVAGDWLAFYFLEGSQGTFSNIQMRYGGRSNGPSMPLGQIHKQGGIVSIASSTLSDSANFNISQSSGTTTVTNSIMTRAIDGVRSTGGNITSMRNTFIDNSRPLFVSGGTLTLESNNFGTTGAPSFVDASVNFQNHGDNTGGKGFAMKGVISGDATWQKDSQPYIITAATTIPAGATLTLEPGTIMKIHPRTFMYIGGTLVSGAASSTDPVVFTSITDDSVAGDTNGDGTLTAPAPGDWLSLYFLEGSQGTFNNTHIRYGGGWNGPTSPTGSINNHEGTITITNSILSDAGANNFRQSGGTSTITNSTIANAPTNFFIAKGYFAIHQSRILNSTEYGVRNYFSPDVIDARENWWGDASGPYNHNTNLGGTTTAIITDWVEYAPWLTADPEGTPPVCTEQCYSNVLFLPGIMGSRLYDSTGSVRWLPEDDAEADYIRMNSNGTSVFPDITTKDAIDTADGQQLYTDLYKSFLAEMKQWEDDYQITATTTPYDWRLNYDTVVNNGRKLSDGSISYLLSPQAGHDPYILEMLKQLASTSPTGKVIIIGHSQGGLIAKALMLKIGVAETARLIDKVIMVATPQLGTPKAVGALLNGVETGIKFAVSSKKAREIAQNMQSAYNLLPSANYSTYVDDPAITISSSTLSSWSDVYGDIIRSEQGMHDFMSDSAHLRTKPAYSDLGNPEIVSSTFLENARSMHATLDAWTPPPGVKLATIAGWGLSTLSGFEYYMVNKCVRVEPIVIIGRTSYYCAMYAPEITLKPKKVIDGDGTVVEPSAQWASGASGASSTRYWVNLDDYNEGFTIDRDHKNILEVPQLRNLIGNIVTGANTALDYISTVAPTYAGTDDRLHFTLHSPLTLGFTDTLSNYTGATATGTAFNIPDVQYERYGEVQWLSIPKELAGQLVLRGTGNGSFTLDIEETSGNDILSRTSFESVPSSTSTVATLEVVPTQSITASSILIVDFDGDSAPDFTLRAHQGTIVTLPPPDLIPPEAQISFSTSTQDIMVEGTDNMGTTTVTKDAAGNYTITDQVGHTTKLFFTKTYNGNRLTYAKLTGIQYDTAPAVTVPTSSFLYVWDKKIPPTLVSQTIAVNNMYIITALYDKTRDKTTVIVLKKNVPVQTLTFVGLRIMKLTTSSGVVGYGL